MSINGYRWSVASLLAASSVSALVAACADDEPDVPDECTPPSALATTHALLGAQPGVPYRWLARSWRSPLGLTFRTYGLAIDGVPIHGRHQVEVYDPRGQLAHRAGSGDAVLAALKAPGANGATSQRFHHPRTATTRSAQPHPLLRDEERPVWHYQDGKLVPAIATERLNLLGERPVAELALRDAVTGAELARHRTIFDAEDPEYLVYAREDGRPLHSPLGDIYPHPTGVPDGSVPATVSQRAIRQSKTTHARKDAPWLDPGGRETRGPNVIAFFNSRLDESGILADLYGDMSPTPEYGPLPDDVGHDFFARSSGDRFAYTYDPATSATTSEHFEDGSPGDPFAPPNKHDVALNAKIVQAFYATNWLHDFFYAAGFDEVAGNAQQTNRGRGGVACDPLIVHAGFFATFTYPPADGESPVLALGLNARSASRRDAAMDFTVTAHEWGHYLVGRLAGDTMGNLQGQSLHEGIADFVSVLANLDAGDDLRGAFPVGSYVNLDYRENRPTLPPEEAPADLYYGVRRYPYSLDLAKNPLTFRHLATPPPPPYFNWKRRGPALAEMHTAGEIFSQALFQCFGNIVAASPTTPFEELRTRMAKYLVAALAAFPDYPTFLEARDAFLTVTRLTSARDHAACRAGFAARGMGSGARGPDRAFDVADRFTDPYNAADIQESFVDAD
jgi:hypothetical protein